MIGGCAIPGAAIPGAIIPSADHSSGVASTPHLRFPLRASNTLAAMVAAITPAELDAEIAPVDAEAAIAQAHRAAPLVLHRLGTEITAVALTVSTRPQNRGVRTTGRKLTVSTEPRDLAALYGMLLAANIVGHSQHVATAPAKLKVTTVSQQAAATNVLHSLKGSF